MKPFILVIFLPFILFEVLLLTSGSPIYTYELLKFNCDKDCTAMLNTFIAHAVKYADIAKNLKYQNKRLTGELEEIGWKTIQRRFDGSENFDRPWSDYKRGFRSKTGEFFIGLMELYTETKKQQHELFIKLQYVNGSTSYAYYSDFQIGSEKENYKLKSLGKYSGTAGDALREHMYAEFTTFDRDNVNNFIVDCPGNRVGGWWYNLCDHSSLNGKYYGNGISEMNNGIYWRTSNSDNLNLKTFTAVEMMIKPLAKSNNDIYDTNENEYTIIET